MAARIPIGKGAASDRAFLYSAFSGGLMSACPAFCWIATAASYSRRAQVTNPDADQLPITVL